MKQNSALPSEKRYNTMYYKYIQLTDKLWQPQNNIFWTQERVDKFVAENDLKNKINATKGIARRKIDWDNFTVELHMDYPIDNGGEIFYLLIDDKYYFAYVISKQYEAGKTVFVLQIDIVTYMAQFVNKGELKGTVAMVRGHLIEKEKNTIHSDSCASIQNNTLELIKSNNYEIDNTPQYFFVANENNNRDVKLYDGSGDFRADIKVANTGVAFSNGNNLIAYSPLSPARYLPIKLISDADDKQTFLDQFYGIDFYSDIWKSKINDPSLIERVMTIPSYGGDWEHVAGLRKIINSPNTSKWFIVPKIIKDIKHNIVEFFELDISEIMNKINFNKENHLLTHYEIDLLAGSIPLFTFNPFFVNQEKKIYGQRIISTDSIKFYFFYNAERIKEFSGVDIECSQGLKTSAYQQMLRDQSVSYYTGIKSRLSLEAGRTGTNLGRDYLISSNRSNPEQSFLNFLYGGVAGAITGLGFSVISNLITRYSQEQDLLERPPIITNVPNFESLVKLIFSNTQTFQVYEASAKSLGSQLTKYETMWFNKDGDLIEKDIKAFYYQVKKPQLQDEATIMLDQKLRGNIVGNELEIENVFAIKRDDYNFFQGMIQPYDLNGHSHILITKFNEILLKGVVLLNKVNE